jgi:tripartite-type tricarboxylate transporter receptor subunit TctC
MPALRNALIIAALVVPALTRPALAQNYPAQSITFVVAFAAGGIADVVGRLVGQKLSERIKQSVIVENRGGAGGNLGARTVSAAAPDGYTILATTSAVAVKDISSRN